MLTFGTASLLTSDSSFGKRAAGTGAAIGQYIRDWDGPLIKAYADSAVVGERSLVFSLAPDARHAFWVVAVDGSDTVEETTVVASHSVPVHPPLGIHLPVLMAISFWVGPEAVPAHTVGAGFPPLPRELHDLALRLTHGGTLSIDALVDEYWRHM